MNATRVRLARESAVEVKEIKSLITAVGYGSRGRDFEELTGKPVMPEVVGMRNTMTALADALYAASGERDRSIFEARKGRSTCLSVFCQAKEREHIDAVAAVLADVPGCRVGGFIFDSVVTYGGNPDDIQKAYRHLDAAGVLLKQSTISMSSADYMTFVFERCGVQDWSPRGPELVNAMTNALAAVAWLKSKHNDSLRGGRPMTLFARAVSPFLEYHYEQGVCQYYDKAIHVWRASGGEDMLRGALEHQLADKLCTYKSHMVEQDVKVKFTCKQEPPDLFIMDPSVVGSVISALKGIPSTLGHTRLDSTNDCTLVFRCGTKLDFRQPYDQQLTTCSAADRNTRRSPMKFEQCHDVAVHAVGTVLGAYLSQMSPTTITYQEVADYCVLPLLSMMKEGFGQMFRRIYYEPAGGQLDGPTPEEKVMEALYSLRQDCGSTSGCRMGLEEMLVEWGPAGNNGKGQKRSVREYVCGTYQLDSEESNGYITVCTARMIIDSPSSSGNQDDVYKAKGCRKVVIDEIKKKQLLSNNLVKSSTGGNTMSAMAKYKHARDVDIKWLLRLIVNDFPSFDETISEADQRRYALILYPCTFRARGDALLP